MALEFTETLTLQIPNVEKQVSAFAEGDFQKNHGLIIEVAAIHEGLTANYNFYGAQALEASLSSWVTPYAKPIILHHDPYTEPVGRVMAAKMDTEADGSPFVRLQVAITDPAAMQKVMDRRYLTGSVGGKAGEAKCSVCEADWANASMFNIPCKHSRGKTYKGKLAYIQMSDISWKEYSFVNMPADQRSSVRSMSTGASAEDAVDDEGWVRSAEFFALNMAKEEILELSESDTRNVLSGLRKKEASPLYLSLKGAFLSALAVAESEDDTEKVVNVSTENTETETEDILAVAEGLSADLANADEAEAEEAEETEASEDAEESTEEASAEEADVDEPAEEETAEETDEVSEEADAEEGETVEEGNVERPQGQEKKRTSDVDPDTSTGADKTRDQISEEEVETVEEEAAPETNTELEEAVQALELRVEELEAQATTLSEENARLKAALKSSLAERVVDTKIALGLHERSEREALLVEHVSRSAGSLADTLRDLASMPVASRANYTDVPKVTEESLAVEDEGDIAPVEAEIVESKPVTSEDIFVDALMGRRSL